MNKKKVRVSKSKNLSSFTQLTKKSGGQNWALARIKEVIGPRFFKPTEYSTSLAIFQWSH